MQDTSFLEFVFPVERFELAFMNPTKLLISQHFPTSQGSRAFSPSHVSLGGQHKRMLCKFLNLTEGVDFDDLERLDTWVTDACSARHQRHGDHGSCARLSRLGYAQKS